MVPQLKNILITAGPTREPIDPVRFISNLSTGEMGYALAAAAVRKKYRVTLVSGPTALKPPKGVRFISIHTARELKRVCTELFPEHDCLIMTAAVCDFEPAKTCRHKISSRGGCTLRLKRTPDVLASLAKRKGSRTVIGFCLETRDLVDRAKAKLREKRLDGIVANYYAPGRSVPFGDRKVKVVLIDSTLKVKRCPAQPKRQIAERLLAWAGELGGRC
ncbi:MAG TPA: phosphopantothenoylcysteine decarboxylase [Candidatus Omnitrophota bacterium]|nr:phosphopantothenoylcysteine decarboxylase [Candidatus Omnitrophota bacterium]HPS36489.1 phosphopantothenoylcysteine decarboxylase [Candidatus Omnitrophota bacterium]